MIIRVPLLLQQSIAVIHRLDIRGTRNVDPAGEPTEGYDPTFNEPIVFTEPTTLKRESSRREHPPIRIPCQMELLTEEKLKELGVGDAPISNLMLVLHRKDLEALGLLDSNQETILKKGDRLSHLEQFGGAVGTITKKFADDGLYFNEVRGSSWGFGPTGYDLEIITLTDRREAPTT